MRTVKMASASIPRLRETVKFLSLVALGATLSASAAIAQQQMGGDHGDLATKATNDAAAEMRAIATERRAREEISAQSLQQVPGFAKKCIFFLEHSGQGNGAVCLMCPLDGAWLEGRVTHFRGAFGWVECEEFEGKSSCTARTRLLLVDSAITRRRR